MTELKHTDRTLLDYMSHRAQLVDYATRILGDRSRGEDVVQEAYLRLRAAPDRTVLRPLGYLRRIVHNLSIDWLRGRSTERNVMVSAPATEEVADTIPSPEGSLAARQELRIVMQAIAELPERTRIALEMHRMEGRKLSEIAAHLGVSTTLAHKLVYEGLAHCRQRLDGEN